MHIWDIILKMLFPIGIVAAVIMELNLRQYGNGCLILIIINWNMGQATVLVEQRAKNVIRNLASLKMENYLKVVNLRRINYVFRSSKL